MFLQWMKIDNNQLANTVVVTEEEGSTMTGNFEQRRSGEQRRWVRGHRGTQEEEQRERKPEDAVRKFGDGLTFR